MCVCVICRVQLVGRFPPCALGPLLGSCVGGGGDGWSERVLGSTLATSLCVGRGGIVVGETGPVVGGGTGSGLAEVCGTCLDYARRADL